MEQRRQRGILASTGVGNLLSGIAGTMRVRITQ